MMSPLEKIRRLSAVMQVITICSLIGLPFLLLALWLFNPMAFWEDPALQPVRRADPDIPVLLRLAAWSVTMIAASPLLYGLDRLRRLFGLYRAGRVFVVDAAQYLRAFAWSVIAMAIVHPIAGAALSVLLTFDNPSGERQLAISMGSGEAQTLFVGILFLVVATIMREAARLADENAQFI